MSNRLWRLMPAVALLIGLGEARADLVVFDQPATFPGAFNVQASEIGPDLGVVRGSRTYDNFRLAETTTLIGIDWQGTYRDFREPGNNPVAPDTTGWEVRFWADDQDQPGALLAARSFGVADVRRQFVGLGNFTNPPPASTIPFYDFSVELSAPFTAFADTTYWLSISEVSPTLNPRWAWASGIGGDSRTVQDEFLDGSLVERRDRDLDRALTLRAVPEPSMAQLVGLGGSLIVLGGVWGRDRGRLCRLGDRAYWRQHGKWQMPAYTSSCVS